MKSILQKKRIATYAERIKTCKTITYTEARTEKHQIETVLQFGYVANTTP